MTNTFDPIKFRADLAANPYLGGQAEAMSKAAAGELDMSNIDHARAVLGMGGDSRQQASGPQAHNSSTDQRPQTTAPPAPNTNPAIFNGVKDDNYTVASDDVTLFDGRKMGQVRAKWQAADTTDEQRATLARAYNVREADPPTGSPPGTRGPLAIPMSAIAGSAAGSGGSGVPGSPGSPGAPGGPDGQGGLGGLPASGATTRSAGGWLGVAGGLGATVNALTATGMSGPAFQMRKVIRSISSSYQDASFVQMLHSNMSIESLLYYWMTYASDKNDKKLREKMEEWTLQSQLEDQQQAVSSAANAMGSVANAVTGTNLGTSLASAAAATINNYTSATQGTGKSSTVLAQEVQILIQQWKTITDMTSNLSKDINDMAMTAVRNLR